MRAAEWAKSAAHRARARVEQERERRFVVALGFAIADRSRQTAASVLAGALAFRFFLVVLPLTLVLVVGLGYLKSAGESPSAALQQFGMKGVLASTINHSADFSDPGRTAVLLLGLIAMISAAQTAAATIRAIHALAWGVPIVRWRRRGRAGMIFLCGVLIGFACAGLAARVKAEAGVALGFGASALWAAVVAAEWLGASLLLPRRKGVSWRALVPGAVLVGVGFAVLQVITVNWLGPKLNRQSALYGSLGVSFVVLGWLYVVGRLLVAAPLLNSALADRRRARSAAGRRPPGRE